MNNKRQLRRESFLSKMSKEAMVPYDVPRGVWEEDEKEYLPLFLSRVSGGRRILDLAGGYAKATTALQKGGNSIVLADLSLPSLTTSKMAMGQGDCDFVRLDMNRGFPFVNGGFDGIWFAQAFEYVPPEMRMRFLTELRKSVVRDGVVFLSAEGVSGIKEWLSYLRWHLYWRIVKRAPIVWGECIYKLDIRGFKGFHYHSLVLSRRFERSLRTAGFEILRSNAGVKGEYRTYLLRAV